MTIAVRAAGPDTPQLPRVLGGRAAAPEEWDVWSEEPGHDLVALDGSRSVGGIHVSLVGRTEAWLENLRVHPEEQGRGTAAALVREAEHLARRFGAAVARTAIPVHEYAAMAVAERAGYRSVLRCSISETAVPAGPVHFPYDAPVEFPTPERTRALWQFIQESPVLAAWDRLVPLGWRFRRISAELVRGLAKDRRAVTALRPDSTDAQAAALFGVRDDAATITCLDGTPPGLQAVFGAVVEDARARGAARIVVFTPDTGSVTALGVRSWTPHPWCPEGLTVVQKSLVS